MSHSSFGGASAYSSSIYSLYIGDLKPEVEESLLYAIFSNVSNIHGVKVCRNSMDGTSLGYGYLNFLSSEEADKAMDAMNLKEISGRPCRICPSNRDPQRRKTGTGNIFIRNIDPSIDSRSLFDAFSSFGKIYSCKMMVDELGKSKGFGFIQFADEKVAETAIASANGVKFRNKILHVTHFEPKNVRASRNEAKDKSFTNVFVKGFGETWSVEELKKFFSKFGEITSAHVKNDEKSGKPVGFGFVNFADPVVAARVVNEIGQHKVNDEMTLSVYRAQKKDERKAYLRQLSEKKRQENHVIFGKRNLYVKNFDDMTDENLREAFAEFGPIHSAVSMKDENKLPRGFGFVCFENEKDADAALKKMNGSLRNGKPIFVSLAQNREQRRKEIASHRAFNMTYRGNSIYSAFPYIYQTLPQNYAQQMRFAPNSSNPIPRQIPRGAMPPNPYSAGFPGARGPQNFHGFPAPYHYQNMRQKFPPGGHNQQRSSYQGNYGPNKYQQHGMPHPNSHQLPRHPPVENVAVTVNHISASDAVNPNANVAKTETRESLPQVTISSGQDPLAIKVYDLAKNLFGSNKFDSSMISKITGIALDTIRKSNPDFANNEDSLKSMLKSICESLTKTEPPRAVQTQAT